MTLKSHNWLLTYTSITFISFTCKMEGFKFVFYRDIFQREISYRDIDQIEPKWIYSGLGADSIDGYCGKRVVVDRDTLRCVRSLVNANEAVTELEHIVSKRNYDELCVLRTIFNIVSDDGDVPEIKRSVNLIHEVQRCRFEDMEREDES